MAIKLVKILSGETLMSDITDRGSRVELYRPLIISITPLLNPAGTQVGVNLGFRTWIHFSNSESVEIPKSYIVCFADPNEFIQQQYALAMTKMDEDSGTTGYGNHTSVSGATPTAGDPTPDEIRRVIDYMRSTSNDLDAGEDDGDEDPDEEIEDDLLMEDLSDPHEEDEEDPPAEWMNRPRWSDN